MTTILLVEDNPAHMKLAGLLLQRAGYHVISAADAAGGLQLAHEWRPDLVLMDIQLPGMDGLEATRRLKAADATRDIPVIAVTAFLAEHPEGEIRAAGCAGMIAKPYHYKSLLAAIEAALPRNE